MKTHVYETVNGLRIEYPEPSPEVARFLAQVERGTSDSKVSHEDLVSLVFGEANPVLEKSPLGLPYVTASVHERPVFRVMQDLLARKQMTKRGLSAEKVAAGYTLTVAQAAERLGVSASAVRQAIAKGKLATWVKGGTYYLHPKWTDQYGRLRGSGLDETELQRAAPSRKIAR
jgi:excisionase family DNA binding protein